MLQANWLNVILLISSFVTASIAFLVYFSKKEKEQNLLFLSLALLSSAGWGTAILLALVTGNGYVGSLAFLAVAPIPAFLILFAWSFREGTLNLKNSSLVLIPAFIISVVCLIPGAVTESINVSKGYIAADQFGPMLPLYIGYIVIYSGLLIYELYKTKKTVTGIKKIQLNYIIFGFITSMAFGFLFNLILPLVFRTYNYVNLGPSFILLMSSSMAYAATKHYLQESQVVFSEVWAFLLVIIVLCWLFLHATFFNWILFIFVLGVCVMFVRSILSEAEKNYTLEK